MSNQQALADQEEQNNASFGKYYPTIFVACGGTGAKVYERVRRHTIERFGSLDQKDLPGVAYVSIDTDQKSQNAGHQQEAGGFGDELGKLISYRPEERVNLDGSGVRHYVESEAALASYPHISEWFDPLLMAAVKGMDISTGAGQVRPIARLVAWDNRDRIVAQFVKAYGEVTSIRGDDASKRVTAGSKVNVVICGSFAGGTGAGIFLDVAAMIRDAQPTVSITGMFVLPDVFLNGQPGLELKANGYACLAELNYYSTEPFRVRWDAAAKVVEIPTLFDRVYLFDRTNESGQTTLRQADTYDIIGDTLFLDFFQGAFVAARSAAQSNQMKTLVQVHKNRREIQKRAWAITSGGAEPITTAEMESYRQRFQSMGLSRVAVSSWRVLNRMSFWLAQQLLDFLDNREELIKDEIPLKREFAQKLGIFQGETTTEDGLAARQYQLREALMVNPGESGGSSTLDDAIELHFNDLTQDDARNGWWEVRTCGQELRKLNLSMEARWAGLDDDGAKGAFVERIATNRKLAFRNVTLALKDVIEAFCERSDVGPHRIAQVMARLCSDIVNSEVYWIKEVEKIAEQARTEAERWEGEWARWRELAADSDNRSFFSRKPAWHEHLQKAQEAGINRWKAVARRKVHMEAAGLMRDVVAYIQKEGIDKQELLATRLQEMRQSFLAFDKEYAKERKSSVFTEFDVGKGDAFEALKVTYLGNSADKQKASLRVLFDKTRAHLRIRTNRELRDRVETQKEQFIRDLRFCCWRALRGANGRTDWFGEERDGLIEGQSVLDYLLKTYGAPNAPQIVTLAQDTFKKAMPWVRTHDGVKVEGIQRECYVVVPKSTNANRAVAEAFYAAVQAAASGTPGLTVAKVQGSETSEFLIYSETTGLIPASISSLHGATGMDQSYRKLADTRKQGNIKSFLHLDRDVVRFSPLVPMNPADSDKVVNAWRLFLLGVIIGVIKTKRNPVRVDATEQSTFPIFLFAYEAPGTNEVVELGQSQSAVRDIAENSALQQRLSEMVNRQYVNQASSRYERLLALVRYYKYCIFPVKKSGPDEGHDQKPRATLAYLALDQIEQELLTTWKTLNGVSNEQVIDLMAGAVPRLLWGIEAFAIHAGQEDHGAGLGRGLEDDQYVEQPPARDASQGTTEVASRRALRDMAYNLLPINLRQNPALREQSKYYPWLRMGPRYSLYLPSQNGGATPEPNDPRRAEKLVEFSMKEAVRAFLASPKDTNEKSGAKWWYHPVGRAKGEYVEWSKIAGLNDEFVGQGGVVDTEVRSPIASPAPGAPPPLAVCFHYFGPTVPTPALLDLAAIVGHLRANPAGSHMVVVNGAWVNAATQPEIAAALTPPAPGLPPMPGLPPVPGLPPLPGAALPPIPAGPFHYVGGTFTAWTLLSGDQVVASALGQPLGSEGHVVENGVATPVTSVPALAAAITSRLR